jgi:hypothetical protein
MRHSMWDFLRKINKEGTTIVLTTHYLEEAEQLCKTSPSSTKERFCSMSRWQTSRASRRGKLENIYLDLIKKEENLNNCNYDTIATLDIILHHAAREFVRIVRIWSQTLLPPVVTTSLYFIVFGKFIGSQLQPIHGFPYIQFIVPGLIMMSVITSSYMNTVSTFYFAKWTRTLDEILVSPMPGWLVVVGFVSGGVLRGLLSEYWCLSYRSSLRIW